MDYEPFSDVESRPSASGGFQFTLSAVFLLMTTAAMVLGSIVALAAALGVDGTGALMQAVGQQIINLPRIIVFLVAIVMLYNRGPRQSRAARFGLVGFGGLLMLSLLGIGFQIFVHAIVDGNSRLGNGSSIGTIFAIYGFITSALSAACYGFLLAAILARTATSAANSAVRQVVLSEASEP